MIEVIEEAIKKWNMTDTVRIEKGQIFKKSLIEFLGKNNKSNFLDDRLNKLGRNEKKKNKQEDRHEKITRVILRGVKRQCTMRERLNETEGSMKRSNLLLMGVPESENRENLDEIDIHICYARAFIEF